MQRTFALILVPALLVVAFVILALRPGFGDPATPTGLVSQESEESKESPAKSPAGEEEPATEERPDESTANKEAKKSSLGRKFGDLLEKERALKGTDQSTPADRAEDELDVENAPNTGDQNTSPAPETAPQPKASTPLTTLARVPADLEELDTEVPINHITITGDHFTNRSLRALSELRILSLSIEAVNVGNAGLVHLKQLNTLRRLRLWTPGINDAGLASLGELANLELLDLEGTNVRGEGLQHLADVDTLVQLTLGPMTEDDDLAALASLSQLTDLDLRPCRQLTDACLEQLAAQRQLKRIWLPPHVGESNRQAVRQRLAPCDVRW